MAFFLASASAAFFSASAFFTISSSSLFFLASSFSCSPLISPLVNVLFQLFIQFILLHTSFSLSKGLISLCRGLGCVGHRLIIAHLGLWSVSFLPYTRPNEQLIVYSPCTL